MTFPFFHSQLVNVQTARSCLLRCVAVGFLRITLDEYKKLIAICQSIDLFANLWYTTQDPKTVWWSFAKATDHKSHRGAHNLEYLSLLCTPRECFFYVTDQPIMKA